MLDTPYDIVGLGSVPSTQDEASSRHGETQRPTLVVSDAQTKGRGRQGRTWEEPQRAMYSSFAFTSDWPESTRPLVTLCTSVALADAIDEICSVSAEIKWPNDLIVGGHKVAGILVEAIGDVVTVGCGANLWWSDPPAYAGAIYSHDPGQEVAGVLAKAWVDRLAGFLKEGPSAWPSTRYLERSCTVGSTVTWADGSGRAAGIDGNGGLIVDTPTGRTVITAGEVHIHDQR